MDVSNGELVRRLQALEANHVSRAVYSRDVTEIKGDLHELKDSQKFVTRLILTQFVTAAGALIVWLITNA